MAVVFSKPLKRSKGEHSHLSHHMHRLIHPSQCLSIESDCLRRKSSTAGESPVTQAPRSDISDSSMNNQTVKTFGRNPARQVKVQRSWPHGVVSPSPLRHHDDEYDHSIVDSSPADYLAPSDISGGSQEGPPFQKFFSEDNDIEKNAGCATKKVKIQSSHSEENGQVASEIVEAENVNPTAPGLIKQCLNAIVNTARNLYNWAVNLIPGWTTKGNICDESQDTQDTLDLPCYVSSLEHTEIQNIVKPTRSSKTNKKKGFKKRNAKFKKNIRRRLNNNNNRRKRQRKISKGANESGGDQIFDVITYSREERLLLRKVYLDEGFIACECRDCSCETDCSCTWCASVWIKASQEPENVLSFFSENALNSMLHGRQLTPRFVMNIFNVNFPQTEDIQYIELQLLMLQDLYQFDLICEYSGELISHYCLVGGARQSKKKFMNKRKGSRQGSQNISTGSSADNADSEECNDKNDTVNSRTKHAKYNESEKRKAAHKRYNEAEKGKKRRNQYETSED